ncbi:hypothetical protein [Streptomyces sp. Ac-502]|uniref:hypothetical protein n=1 Tax=Streptomyces sp. Ac-502 TaxID=3342801 RepID=UPI00386226C5
MNLRGLLRRRSPATPCPACGSTDVLWEDEGVYGAGELLWWCASCLHQWHPGDLGAGPGGGPAGPVGPAAPTPAVSVPLTNPAVPAPPVAPAPPANPAASVPPPPPLQPPSNAPLQPPPNTPGPATVAERVMHAAGLIPLGPCPGAYEPWPCHCSRCGRATSPTYRQVRDEGVGCACSTGRRRKPRFLTRP